MEDLFSSLHLILGVTIAVILTVFVVLFWQNKRHKQLAETYYQKLQDTFDKMGQLNEHNKQLEVRLGRRYNQISKWFHLRRYVAKCLKNHGAVVGLGRVRKQPKYIPRESNLAFAHLWRDGNWQGKSAFDPVPLRPIRNPIASGYEPALVLTDDTREEYNFKVTVVRAADVQNAGNKKFLARIGVEISYDGNEYTLDIHTDGKSASGATSLALDYIIARGKREKISTLTGKLIHINDEEHRSRLYYFYVDKYGFEEKDDYITKIL